MAATVRRPNHAAEMELGAGISWTAAVTAVAVVAAAAALVWGLVRISNERPALKPTGPGDTPSVVASARAEA